MLLGMLGRISCAIERLRCALHREGDIVLIMDYGKGQSQSRASFDSTRKAGTSAQLEITTLKAGRADVAFLYGAEEVDMAPILEVWVSV